MSPTLSTNMLHKIMTLFEEKEWEIEDELDNPNSLYNRFCSLFSVLDESEQNFLYNLTKSEFLRVDFKDYPLLIQQLLIRLHNTDNKNIDKIYVAPLACEKDIGKIKSSSLVSYLFKSVNVLHNSFQSDIIVIDCIDSISNFIPKINDNPKAVLLIVDDFIGTGESATDCLSYIEKNSKIDTDKIIVTSLIAQRQGIDLIEKAGYSTLIGQVRNKGISGNASLEPHITESIKLMEGIEEKIKVSKSSNFGYRKSEALVSLIRTPNNTFPVYWHQKGHHKHKAPFPRYG